VLRALHEGNSVGDFRALEPLAGKLLQSGRNLPLELI